jgi:hypothetical protein
VLSVPVAGTHYEPGRGWNTAIGSPDTQRAAEVTVTEHQGLGSLEAGDTTGLDAKISVPVIEWIGGALGIRDTEKVGLSLQSLRHTVVADARTLTGTGAVLWEAVTADSMALAIDTSGDASLDLQAGVVQAKLAQAGAVGLQVNRVSAGQYRITAAAKLVVMIRVVELQWQSRGGDSPFDLSSAGRNREQQALLGYRVKSGDPFDPLEEKVRLSVHNDGFPQWTGDAFTTSRDRPTWANTRREVITSGDDAAARNARFVWDSIRVLWDQDLTKCQLHTVRQYLTLRNVGSGLRGTR